MFAAVPSVQPAPPAQPGSLRDHMLKEPDSNRPSIQDEYKPDTQPRIPSSDSSRLHPDLRGDGQNPENQFPSIVSGLSCAFSFTVVKC